jgi:ABC-type branched-subunit amino acid transport system ATPase component
MAAGEQVVHGAGAQCRSRAAIAADARYLLLDEPAAGIGRDEMKVLAAEIRGLAGRGIGVLLVEHNSLIHTLCEEVTVLDTGTRDLRARLRKRAGMSA